MAALLASFALLSPSPFLGKTVAPPPNRPTSTSTTSAPHIVSLFSKRRPSNPANSKPPANGELAKWYGTERRICLPEGLLDRSEVPAYLTGEVPGDYGFDPFGLSKKLADFDKYQAYELLHTRWAMLGAAGFVLLEAFNKFGASCGPKATGALLLDGGTLSYFGATVPVNLAAAVIAEIMLVGGAEYFLIQNKQGFNRLDSGGPFDPLGLAKDPDQFALPKVKGMKNGRLAMFSMLGFFLQAYVTREGPAENLTAHLSYPFGNNLLAILQGTAERAPSL